MDDLVKTRGSGCQKGFSQSVKTELRLKGKSKVARGRLRGRAHWEERQHVGKPSGRKELSTF